MNSKYFVGLFCGLLLLPGVSLGGAADVIAVKMIPQGAHRYDVSVTVRHADSGWDHYANQWDLIDVEGNIIASRVLLHPHVDEQPFTRGLTGVVIPAHITRVIVRAHDLVHGYGGEEVSVDLAR
ncbi:hypothetical protein [Amphritea sp.]|uniref:hypothetical protein n=1 Tax=Amphritea sp. TaxID=1872502 RepID=UPI003A94845B